MELHQALALHARLPVWCLSRANTRLVEDALGASLQLATTWDGRDYTSDLAGLFELINVRYLGEGAELGPGPITLKAVLRTWLIGKAPTATIGNLIDCLGLLHRADILNRLDTRQLVEYYHVYLGYHSSDAAKARELAGRLTTREPSLRLFDCQTARMPPGEVPQRCFSSVLLVSMAYLDESSDYCRVLHQEKCNSNYPLFCITVDSATVQNLPRWMRLFPPLLWRMLPHNDRFLEQLLRCIRHREEEVVRSVMLRR